MWIILEQKDYWYFNFFNLYIGFPYINTANEIEESVDVRVNGNNLIQAK